MIEHIALFLFGAWIGFNAGCTYTEHWKTRDRTDANM